MNKKLLKDFFSLKAGYSEDNGGVALQFELNPIRIYYCLYEKFPKILNILVPFCKTKLNNYLKDKAEYIYRIDYILKDKRETPGIKIIVLYKDSIIETFDYINEMNIYAPSIEKAKEIYKELFQHCEETQESKSSIHILIRKDGGLEVEKVDFKPPIIDLETNYCDGFKNIHEKVINGLNNHSNGIMLFSGSAGTGKTNYLRHLATIVDRPFIFIPSYMVDDLISPDLLPVLMEIKDSVLIIEDAEKAIIKREENPYGSLVSTILNLADGFMADVLQCSLILTFNSEENKIDDAILRKGRLRVSHKFDLLPAGKANKLLTKLGKSHKTSIAMSLAEIYNCEDDTGYKKEEEKRIGFGN